MTGTLLLTLMVASVLMSRCPDSDHIGWYALISTCVLVVSLELLQLLNPVRAFQFQDIVEGFAGAALGSIISALVFTYFGQ